MTNNKKIIGNNIKTFIDSRELRHEWVMERVGIGNDEFYDMLDGIGIIDGHVSKINEFFGIDDPMYFRKTDIEFKKPKVYLNRKEGLLRQVALSYPGKIPPNLKEGLEVFVELVELVDVLKATSK
ncbi:hypothetical protein [Bacillus bombysepticus]|uniref:hypothetical protein n=1 Tax=Bacillus bombysepticus TaxID=658666 RepID=UPI00301963AF